MKMKLAELKKRIRILVEPPSNVTHHEQMRRLGAFFESFDSEALIADIGSGYNKYSDRCIAIDIIEYDGVDILGNLYNIPLSDGSLDGIVVRGVLEHVEAPEKAVEELKRVLKPGGMIYSSIPFMQAYHPSPGDYQRYTIQGIERLFSGFEKIDCGITRGSGSSFVWIGREYFSQLLSLNNMTLYKIWKVFFGWTLQPFKYTDYFLNHHRMAHLAASGFTFIGRK